MTRREPEWTQHERHLLMAARSLRSDRGPHGHRLSESTSALADPARRDRQWGYVAAPLPTVDYAAKALGDAQDAYKKLLPKDTPMPNGLLFSVKRVEY